MTHKGWCVVKHQTNKQNKTSVSPFPVNWLAARLADLTPDLQVLLSWGSTVVSFILNNLFMQHDYFLKQITFWPHPRVKGKCKSKIFAYMLL